MQLRKQAEEPLVNQVETQYNYLLSQVRWRALPLAVKADMGSVRQVETLKNQLRKTAKEKRKWQFETIKLRKQFGVTTGTHHDAQAQGEANRYQVTTRVESGKLWALIGCGLGVHLISGSSSAN